MSDELAEVIDPPAFKKHAVEPMYWSQRKLDAIHAARKVLASDWLTRHDAQVKVAALKEAAGIARKTIDEWTDAWQPNAKMRPLEDCVAEDILAASEATE